MHSSPSEKIQISPNRQRQEFDPEALVDLANSIAAHGLMHPPVMRETPNGLVLVAGERRLRAIEQLHMLGTAIRCNGLIFAPGEVPYVTLGELDEIAAEEAELDENLKREDLTWQEEAAAIARLHALRTRQAELVGGFHFIADTTRELKPEQTAGLSDGQLGAYRAEVKQNIILASHLDNPEVAKAKNAKEAVKVLKRQEEQAKNRDLAERIGKTFNSSAHQLHHANCLEWLKTCHDNSFDVILTDPPYGMGAQDEIVIDSAEFTQTRAARQYRELSACGAGERTASQWFGGYAAPDWTRSYAGGMAGKLVAAGFDQTRTIDLLSSLANNVLNHVLDIDERISYSAAWYSGTTAQIGLRRDGSAAAFFLTPPASSVRNYGNISSPAGLLTTSITADWFFAINRKTGTHAISLSPTCFV